MLSQTVEYALRAMVYLASYDGEPQPTDRIAATTKVPAAYLSKVLQNLSRQGLVESQRGVKGGFLLSQPPEEITVLDVVNAVDPIQRIHSCPLELKSHGVRLCPLHFRMDAAMEMVEDAFRKSTLAEILAEPTQSVPLCESPMAAGE